jgi:hypothetical protein
VHDAEGQGFGHGGLPRVRKVRMVAQRLLWEAGTLQPRNHGSNDNDSQLKSKINSFKLLN